MGIGWDWQIAGGTNMVTQHMGGANSFERRTHPAPEGRWPLEMNTRDTGDIYWAVFCQLATMSSQNTPSSRWTLWDTLATVVPGHYEHSRHLRRGPRTLSAMRHTPEYSPKSAPIKDPGKHGPSEIRLV